MGTVLNNRFTRPVFKPIMRSLLLFAPSRAGINMLYNRMTFRNCEGFFWSFVEAFRSVPAGKIRNGSWTVKFGATYLHIPFRDGLHADLAIAMRGHDHTVKETYEAILAGPSRPDVFVDIGASYGTHSLLMAGSGVRCIAFEPNPICLSISLPLFQCNGISVDWRSIAIGDHAARVILRYPEENTTLGSVVTPDSECRDARFRLVEVKQERLDDQSIPEGVVLIKIDVEGGELKVLRGGESFIRRRSPKIIFECFECDTTRLKLLEYFSELSYSVVSLPVGKKFPLLPLSKEEFLSSSETNFMAIPRQLANEDAKLQLQGCEYIEF